MSQRYYSPLRYPGGKGKLFRYIKDLISHNNLHGVSYSEPYAGGASIALGLLIEGYVSRIYINDIDEGIHCFWSSILNHTDEFLRKMWHTELSVEEWKKQFYIQRNKTSFSQLDVGFSTFFLNRTNRSGIINAGIIGGLDQAGNYKIDARFNKEELSKRIKNIACHKDYIHLHRKDAVNFINRTLARHKTKGLVFLDPPYYIKGKKLYTSFYEHADHVKVEKVINKSSIKYWIVTYDNTPEINEIYKSNNKVAYDIKYSLNHQSTSGSELLFYSDNLKLPYHPNEKPY